MLVIPRTGSLASRCSHWDCVRGTDAHAGTTGRWLSESRARTARSLWPRNSRGVLRRVRCLSTQLQCWRCRHVAVTPFVRILVVDADASWQTRLRRRYAWVMTPAPHGSRWRCEWVMVTPSADPTARVAAAPRGTSHPPSQVTTPWVTAPLRTGPRVTRASAVHDTLIPLPD